MFGWFGRLPIRVRIVTITLLVCSSIAAAVVPGLTSGSGAAVTHSAGRVSAQPAAVADQHRAMATPSITAIRHHRVRVSAATATPTAIVSASATASTRPQPVSSSTPRPVAWIYGQWTAHSTLLDIGNGSFTYRVYSNCPVQQPSDQPSMCDIRDVVTVTHGASPNQAVITVVSSSVLLTDMDGNSLPGSGQGSGIQPGTAYLLERLTDQTAWLNAAGPHAPPATKLCRQNSPAAYASVCGA